MHRLLRKFSSKNYIPQFGGNSEALLLSAEVVLVVISLQAMEICAFVFGGVDMMQGVMGQIVGEVADYKTKPQSKVILLVIEIYEPIDGLIAD